MNTPLHSLHSTHQHNNDFPLAVAISDIVSRVYSLGIDVHQVSAFEKHVRKVRSTFTRLRDNPSQKMGKSLQQLADEIDAIHQGLVALEAIAFPIPKIGHGRLGLGYNQMPSLAVAS